MPGNSECPDLPCVPGPSLDFKALMQRVLAARPGTQQVAELVDATFGITSREVTRLITACRRPRQWRIALEVLKVAKERSGLLNFFTFSAAISVCCKAGRMDEALLLLEDMRAAAEKDSSLAPDSVVYRLVIALGVKQGMQEKALELYREMCSMGIEPDDQTLVNALNALVDLKKWKRAGDVLEKLHVRRGYLPVEQYNSFLEACVGDGNMDVAVEVFLTMQIVGVQPDSETCLHMMLIIEKSKCPHLGVELLEGMLAAGITPVPETYRSLVRCASESWGMRTMANLFPTLLQDFEKGNADVVHKAGCKCNLAQWEAPWCTGNWGTL